MPAATLEDLRIDEATWNSGSAERKHEWRLAIHEIMAKYCQAIDLNRWEEFPSLFTEDCRLDSGKLMGVFEGADGVQRFTETMRSLGLFMRHYTTNVVLRGDGERVQSEAYVLAITGPPG